MSEDSPTLRALACDVKWWGCIFGDPHYCWLPQGHDGDHVCLDCDEKLSLCEHGIETSEFCIICAHSVDEDWCGHPVSVCRWERVAWPCEYEAARRAAERADGWTR